MIEGSASHTVAQAFFPLAGLKFVEATKQRDAAMRSVVSGTSDLIISDKLSVQNYTQSYPDVLKTIVPKNTIARVPLTFSFLRSKDTLVLKDMIDEGIRHLWTYVFDPIQ